jgi:DNA-binding CsgD family transcriptional regulator
VFLGGFGLDAAQAVAGAGDIERYQVLDQLTLLVDKSLVVAETISGATRYRLLETVRQYALEKLSESGEAAAVRTRHRTHYTGIAASLDPPDKAGHEDLLAQVDVEIDNLRAAFAWSRDNRDPESALHLTASLQPFWLARGRVHEGLAWFDAVLSDGSEQLAEVAPAIRSRAASDRAILHAWVFATDNMQTAEDAVTLAREVGDPALLARALIACDAVAINRGVADRRYLAEALDLARASSDASTLSHVLGWMGNTAYMAGDPIVARAAGDEGRDVAAGIDDRFTSRQCRTWLAWAHMITGDLARGAALYDEVAVEARTDHDLIWWAVASVQYAGLLAYRGDLSGARAAAEKGRASMGELGELYAGNADGWSALAELAAGDIASADRASAAAWEHLTSTPAHQNTYVFQRAEVALVRGDLADARRWADDAVSGTTGWNLVVALTTRSRVAIAQGELEQAERDAHDALGHATRIQAILGVPDILDCLARLAGEAGDWRQAARLFGATEAIRQRIGVVRFKTHHADCESCVARLRDALGDSEIDSAWAEGAALSTEEAIAYAQRGRGERKRPSSGWASLTPTERDVVRLVSEGLSNSDVAARLFVSPRTVQTHLTHIYTKLGLTSRVQLVQEAARHSSN